MYEQYGQTIKSVTSTTIIIVYGDATSLLVVDDYILCPLKDYETDLQISVISYSAGSDETTITFTSGSFTSVDAGRTIAKIYYNN